MSNFIYLTILLAVINFVTAQIIPPIARCEDTGDNTTCLLSNVKVSKTRPNFRIRSPSPDDVRSVFITNSTVPVLINNICNAFLNVRSITAQRIYIEEIREDAFEDCTRLISLDLSDNVIKSLPDRLFQNVISFNYLYLDSNFIKEIPDGLFGAGTALKAFNLNHNRLKEVPVQVLKKFKDLTCLQVHSNDILNFNEKEIVETFPSLQSFEFNNNQLSCDRQFKIQEYLRDLRISFPYTALPRQRFHLVNTIGFYVCVGDVEWTGLYYKRVAENHEIEKLKQEVKELQTRIDDELDLVIDLLTKTIQKENNV